MDLKRIICIILVACLLLSLLAGISFSVFAEPAGLAFTGLGEVAPGATIDTQQITGAPEGFWLHAMLSAYNYDSGWFETVEDGVVGQKGVYELTMVMWGKDGAGMTWDQYEAMCECATIDGMEFDEITTQNCDEDFVYEVAFYKLFMVGDIQIVDTVVFDELPPVEAGTPADLSQVRLADSVVGCYIDESSYWYDEWGKDMGEVLEDGSAYHLVLNLRPCEGYWFDWELWCDAPMEPYSAFTDYVWGRGYVDFRYSLSREITRLDISVDANPQYGAPIEVPAISVDADAELNIQSHWSFEGMDGWNEVEGGTFGYGTYSLFITLQTQNNTTFRDPLDELLINGMPWHHQENVELWSESEQHVTLRLRYYVDPPMGYVDYIWLAGAPGKVEPGDAMVIPEIEVLEGQLSITGARWEDEEGNPVSGNFEFGKKYLLALQVVPEEGYALRNDNPVEMETVDGFYKRAWMGVKQDGTGVVYAEYNLIPTVDAVDVKVTVPQIGAEPAAPTVAEDALYYISGYTWQDYDTGEPVVQFEEGKKYTLHVSIWLQEGYRIDEELRASYNGKPVYRISWSENTISLYIDFSFKKQIQRVDITMDMPQIGDAADFSGISLPVDAPYYISVDNSYWYGENEGFEGVFAKDKYYLRLCLMAKDGLEFHENVKVYINGQYCDYAYVEGGGEELSVEHSISFRDKITQVEISRLPDAINPGDTIDPLEEIETDRYTGALYWAILNEDGISLEPVTHDKFQNNSTYFLIMSLEAKAGYEFSDDFAVLFEGQKVEGITLSYETGADYAKMYALGVEVIDTVDLIAPAPEAGKPLGEVALPQGAPYEMLGYDVGVSDTEKDEGVLGIDEETPAEAGKFYWISGVIVANEGYVFADTLTIRINGKVMDRTHVYGSPVALGRMGIFFDCIGQAKETAETTGDIDGDGQTTADDVIALLLHVTMPDVFAVDVNADYNGDGELTADDVIALLLHVTMPDVFPL